MHKATRVLMSSSLSSLSTSLGIKKGLYKESFYLKSLTLKTDFSRYKRHYMFTHPRYFDVVRESRYSKEHRDHKKLRINTHDPLFFDHKNKEINGGIHNLCDHIRLEKSFTLSPYRCIYMMYNMGLDLSKKDVNLFKKIDGLLTIKAFDDPAKLGGRYTYGALYGYYRYECGKPEHIMFFQNYLVNYPWDISGEEAYNLMEVLISSSYFQREYVMYLFDAIFKRTILCHWDSHFVFRQSLLTKLLVLFADYKLYDEDIWKFMLATVFHYKVFSNTDDYQKILIRLNRLNEDPTFHQFQKLGDAIEKYKDLIRNNVNKNWKFDVDQERFRNHHEMLAMSREDEDFVFEKSFNPDMVKKEKIIAKVKVKFSMKDLEDLVQQRFDAKTSVIAIRTELVEKRIPPHIIDKVIVDVMLKNQTQIMERYRKEGKILNPENKEDFAKKAKQLKAVLPAPTPMGGKGGAAKGGKK